MTGKQAETDLGRGVAVKTVDSVISFVSSADFFRPLSGDSSGLVVGALADCLAVFVKTGAANED